MTSDVSLLGPLDRDDPRPASHQIAQVLRAAIRTGKLAPGDRLPSQLELAERYGVARETVKSALRILRDERLTVSRQGSGVFVRAQTERPVGLRPHIEAAFERPHVGLDFAGFSGETLHGVLTEVLDKVRAGRLSPQSIAVRMLLPDFSLPSAIPARSDTGADDPELRDRADRISRRHIDGIVAAVHELADLGLVRSATARVRVHAAASTFKLYMLNDEEVFFAFYPVVQHIITVGRRSVPIYDVMGKDTVLFHRTKLADDTTDDSDFVAEARKWFNSMWTTISHDPPS